jgi:hypothetical protein
MAGRTDILILFPIKVYDETIRVLKSAIANSKLGREDCRRSNVLATRRAGLNGWPEAPSLETFIASELAASPELDGRSIFGWERDLGPSKVMGS